MTHDRPYRRAISVPKAVSELWLEAGRQFDRALVPLPVVEVERDDDRATLDLPPSGPAGDWLSERAVRHRILTGARFGLYSQLSRTVVDN
jgi:hypothetical protein